MQIPLENNIVKSLWLDAPQSGLVKNSAIAVGSFDGVHLGHKSVIERLVAGAEKKKLVPVLVTFDPHPRIIFSRENSFILTTPQERELLLRAYKVKLLVHIRFTEDFSKVTYEQFLEDYLIKTLGAKLLIVGYDHHFGRKREGTPQKLKELSKNFGVEIEIVDSVSIGNNAIKSSEIRELIGNGKLEKANKLLGHNYIVIGKVIAGRGIGKMIGYPTANLNISLYKLLPPDGIYAGRTGIGFQTPVIPSAIYIGCAPTFRPHSRMFEVHLIGQNCNLYNNWLTVEILSKIRDDRTFRTSEELKKQIEKDIEKIENYLPSQK